ncbi:MAG: AMP-binding protein [Lachnospiraceae bacterium]|nr:AMP-binding protein [Lachnospiraceae bacterium]
MHSFYNDIDQYQDRVALVTDTGENITYHQLVKDADDLFQDIPSRTLVFLVCKNNRESVTGYVGCQRNRIVPVMINDGISGELFLQLSQRYQPQYIFSSMEFTRKILDGGSDLEEVKRFGNYNLYQTSFQGCTDLYEELALLLTTSGSTGSPKLVRQSYKNINANTDSIAQYLDIGEHDRAMTTMPMSYTYGLSIINSHLYKGARIILSDYALVNKEFWQLLKKEQATTFGGVPYIYEMLKKLRFGRMDLPSLKYITQAGGKLSKELAQEFYEICTAKGIRMIVMYGQTEATARMSYLPWESAGDKAGSMGIAIPNGRFELLDANGQIIKDSEIAGELVYYGDNVTLGYAEGFQDLSKGDENRGVLYTGDMAKRDADGFYYIVGRKKRFLKIFGNRINLDEVEEMLKKEGYSCVCAGYDDKMKIYTMQKEGWNEIIEYISQQTGLHSSAFAVVYIEEIPRNEAGKILYSALPE